MKLKRIQIVKAISIKKKKKRKLSYNTISLQAILQSYSNQNSIVLSQNEAQRSMEQNRELINRPMHI